MILLQRCKIFACRRRASVVLGRRETNIAAVVPQKKRPVVRGPFFESQRLLLQSECFETRCQQMVQDKSNDIRESAYGKQYGISSSDIAGSGKIVE